MAFFKVKRTDIDFSGDDIHRFLPWLIGVMACLTTLLLCLTVSINGWIETRHNDYSSSFTINIPTSAKKQETIAAVKDAITSTKGVDNVAEIPESSLQDSLKSWLGSGDVSALPLPVVLEVTLKPDAQADFNHAALKQKLTAISPAIEIDTYEQWVAAFASFSGIVQALMIMLACIIIAAMAAAVVFTSRTALKLHARSVALLHSIGAEDNYITKQFQQDTFFLVLPGLLIGVALAGLVYWGCGQYISTIPVSVFPSLEMSFGHYLVLFLIPFICSVGSGLVARFAVLNQLRRTL
ncbi:MAG: cell division protein FtsX [Alphaproteobacteria bacterium]